MKKVDDLNVSDLGGIELYTFMDGSFIEIDMDKLEILCAGAKGGLK